MDHSPIDFGLDLDLLGILGATIHEGSVAARAAALVLWEFDAFLANGQVGVIPSLGARPLRLLATTPNGTIQLGIFQIVCAVQSRGLFAATAEEVSLQLEIFTGKLVSFLLGGFEAFDGPCTHGLPVTHLLFEALVIPLQAGNVVA
jgi:hypothetical protein